MLDLPTDPAGAPAPTAGMMGVQAGLAAPKSGMQRDAPKPDESRAALVTRWTADVKRAKKHWEKDFKRMRRNMEFASGKQWPGHTDDDDRYTVNITQRIIKSAVASMYAKNPTVVAKRRETLDFQVWDGKIETLQMAQQALQMAATTGSPPDPEVMAILQDVQQGSQRRQMMDRLGRTLEILARYYMEECEPDFKLQMKQMVRRTRTTGVGYVEIGFQRLMELSDDQTTRISDMTERLSVIGRMQADLQDGEADPMSAEAEELKLAVAALQGEPQQIVREGLVWTFPQSTRIIPSIETSKLIGWIGSEWLAKEITLTADRVKEVYGVDVGKSFTTYKSDAGSPTSTARARAQKTEGAGLCCVWHIFDKGTGLEYVICDGYPDFLKAPAVPDVSVEQFFPIFAITFNETEDEDKLFPQSDVELVKHVQKEMNRCKEAKRQHRIANRPLYLAPDGMFDESEEKSLADYPAHAVVKLKAMRDGIKVDELLTPMKKVGVDPNLYETQELMRDALMLTGYQEANLGGTGSGTATESSIAQSSLAGATGLDADDLDEMLTRLMRAAGQIMLMNLSQETVTKIAGPGAIWPELAREDIMGEIGLEVKAGSSGRPNQAQRAATLERMYPLLVQVPGVSPRWLAELAIGIADDDVDLTDAILDGLPSIVAQNAMSGPQVQPNSGDPASNPGSQGPAGARNAPTPGPTGDSGQPGFSQGSIDGGRLPVSGEFRRACGGSRSRWQCRHGGSAAGAGRR